MKIKKAQLTLNNLFEYEYIDLKNKFPTIFKNATKATIQRIGKFVTLNIDSAQCFDDINEINFPKEFEYIVPKDTIYGTFSTQNGDVYVIVFSWLNFRIYHENKKPIYPEVLYGQLHWII